jgi:uncharacterized membrane protein YbhN (UPF0104 family)
MGRLLNIVLFVIVLGASAWVLTRVAHAITLAQLTDAIATTAHWRIAAAIAFTAISFGALASYDVIAARLAAPGAVPSIAAAFAGATGSAVSHTLGFHAVTGSAVRYRIYRHWGVGLRQIARILALSWAALGLGFLAALSAAFLMEPSHRVVGGFMAAALAVLLAWMARAPRSLRFRKIKLSLPSGRLAPTQVLIGAVETAATVAALYVLIPTGIAPPFSLLAIAFIGSGLLGIVSHAPGGIGVFEASMLSIFPSGHTGLLAALLMFRLIYNILPFVVSAIGLAAFEIGVNSNGDSGG